MNKLEHNGQVYALLSQVLSVVDEKDNTTTWFGKETEPLQGSRMNYMKGKVFKTHKHKMNPRLINKTQEAFIVIRGKLQVEIWEDQSTYLGKLIAGQGDIIFVWKGFHKISILEDNTVAYEIKAGQFTSVEEDKEFLDV